MPISVASERRLLELRNVQAGYDGVPVVRGVSLSVSEGEIVGVIGHNGAGKSTVVKTVFGILTTQGGAICLRGERIDYLKPWQRCRAGLAYAPQGSALFSSLTVRQNLRMALALVGREKQQVEAERFVEQFPGMRRLLDRRGCELSGGERQIASVLRAFAMRPVVVLLDEPSMGLAPSATVRLVELIVQAASATGCGVLLVEQKVSQALAIAARVCVLRRGEVTYYGNAGGLASNERRLRQIFL